MHRSLTVGIGASALALAATVAGFVVPAGFPGPSDALVAQPASAAGLTAFEDCDRLLAWYVDRSMGRVGAWGWGGRYWTTSSPVTEDASAGRVSGQVTARGPVANGPTGTNTQEAGVDEPDVAKTDGRLVVRLVDGQRVVLTDVSTSSPRDLGSWRVPEHRYADGLLLVGDHVLVTGGTPQMVPMATERVGPGFAPVLGGTTVTDLDVSDPVHPVVVDTTTWSGRELSLRQYGETVRLVTATGLPDLPFVHPRPGRLTSHEAAARNREIVRHSAIEDWLPGIESADGSRAAVSCTDVLHPGDPPRDDRGLESLDTVAIATFRPGGTETPSTVAVTAAGDDVYSSTDRLYVTAGDWAGRRVSTRIHAFALDGDRTRYVASGSVDGSVRDHWSLDEYAGTLRVALAWRGPNGQTLENGIATVRERGDRLVPTGLLRGLGRREEIQSVRWFDDLAVVVTFRQVDPLYTVDLADPARPRVLGALKVPGYSGYLHPIGADRLLGLGTAATSTGRSLGAQAAVFDLADPARARRLGAHRFGPESHLAAAEDPHAFTWLSGASAAVTTLSAWSTPERVSLVLLSVSPSGELSTRTLPSPGGWAVRALPLGGDRVALVGDRVLVESLDRD